MTPKEIIAEVDMVVRRANQLFGLNMSRPNIKFINRGCRSGRAMYYTDEIEFNEILARENPDTFHNTVKHEVSHLVAYKVYGEIGKGHGKHFKSVFIRLGGNGKRTHSYDVSSVKQKYTRRKFGYNCKCVNRIFWVSATKHNKLMYNSRAYICKTCKSGLTHNNEIKETIK